MSDDNKVVEFPAGGAEALNAALKTPLVSRGFSPLSEKRPLLTELAPISPLNRPNNGPKAYLNYRFCCA